jgi:hypothetical protein
MAATQKAAIIPKLRYIDVCKEIRMKSPRRGHQSAIELVLQVIHQKNINWQASEQLTRRLVPPAASSRRGVFGAREW